MAVYEVLSRGHQESLPFCFLPPYVLSLRPRAPGSRFLYKRECPGGVIFPSLNYLGSIFESEIMFAKHNYFSKFIDNWVHVQHIIL